MRHRSYDGSGAFNIILFFNALDSRCYPIHPELRKAFTDLSAWHNTFVIGPNLSWSCWPRKGERTSRAKCLDREAVQFQMVGIGSGSAASETPDS